METALLYSFNQALTVWRMILLVPTRILTIFDHHFNYNICYKHVLYFNNHD